MVDFSAFEAFEGKKPSLLLDQHPDGKHLAMQIETADVFLAASIPRSAEQKPL
jgi:hypothetical protein